MRRQSDYWELEKIVVRDKWPTVGARLEGLISDNYQHVGQIAYIRGLLKGRGWWEAARGLPKPNA